MQENEKIIRCPQCAARLFDLKSGYVTLAIKCVRCKAVLEVVRPRDQCDIQISAYRAKEWAPSSP